MISIISLKLKQIKGVEEFRTSFTSWVLKRINDSNQMIEDDSNDVVEKMTKKYELQEHSIIPSPTSKSSTIILNFYRLSKDDFELKGDLLTEKAVKQSQKNKIERMALRPWK